MDIVVPLILEKIVQMIQLVPLERIKDQIVEQIVAVLVPQIKEDIRSACKSCCGADRERASAPDHDQTRGFRSACAS